MGFSQAMNIASGFESPQDPSAGWKAQMPSSVYDGSL
jgi:hypothetical protein